jgi:hypothetical protein
MEMSWTDNSCTRKSVTKTPVETTVTTFHSVTGIVHTIYLFFLGGGGGFQLSSLVKARRSMELFSGYSLNVDSNIVWLQQDGNGTVKVYGAGLNIITRGGWYSEGVWSRLEHYHTWGMVHWRCMEQACTLSHVGDGTLKVYGAGLHITTRGGWNNESL